MKHVVIVLTLFFAATICKAQAPKTIHVFVALCDNENQGIVPVNATLGNGQNPASNLYWGALYGVKTWFKRSKSWTLVQSWTKPETNILERLLFKHVGSNTYLLADAWDGAYIKPCMAAFVAASGNRGTVQIPWEGSTLNFGGKADCVAYTGHNGLMEFSFPYLTSSRPSGKSAIVLACAAKSYLAPHFEGTGAIPLVWTTGLMAPEAYTLEAALTGWIKNESVPAVRERAAQAYHKYQKCGITGARRLFDCPK